MGKIQHLFLVTHLPPSCNLVGHVGDMGRSKLRSLEGIRSRAAASTREAVFRDRIPFGMVQLFTTPMQASELLKLVARFGTFWPDLPIISVGNGRAGNYVEDLVALQYIRTLPLCFLATFYSSITYEFGSHYLDKMQWLIFLLLLQHLPYWWLQRASSPVSVSLSSSYG